MSAFSKLAIASDHAGFELKNEIIAHLKSLNIPAQDLGCYSKDSVDYPDYAAKVSGLISNHETEAGILVCGTGVGMCMTANKFPGVRAAVVSEAYSAKMSRAHNDANILCLGARVVDIAKAKEIVGIWVSTAFEGGRHAGRVQKINHFDSKL